MSLVASRMDKAKNSMANSLGDLFFGYGAGKDIEGLGLIVDDGTATTSYGGITRADIGQTPMLQQHKVVTRHSSSSVPSLTQLAQPIRTRSTNNRAYNQDDLGPI